jgi:predicted Zn-dependent protease
VFTGADFKNEGTHILDLKDAAEVELARLDTLSSKDRPKGYVALKQGLLAQATASQTAQEWVEKGGRALMKARRAIESGLENHATNPNFKLATALHRAQDTDTLTRAEQYLRMYLEGLGLNQEDLAKPSNHWMAYTHGLILMANETTRQEAPAAFSAAIALEPRFQRARLRLAQSYHKLGQVDEAVQMLEQVVQAQPKHVQATRLLASWKITVPAALAPVAKEAEDTKVETKKSKKKKRGKKGKKRGKKGKKNKKGKKSKKGKKNSK